MSADFREYVDLTPLDISPVQVYLDSIEVARTVFPGFDLRVGTIEDAMFQAFAYMSALNIGAINRIPDAIFLGAIKMMGTPYNDGTRATMDVTFTANSNDGATIPAGTLVAFLIIDDELEIQYVFETDELLTIASNTLGDPLPVGTVGCTAQSLGTIPTVPNSSTLSIVSYMPNVFSAVSAGNFVQGQDAESVDQFLQRGVANLATMSSALVTASQLQNYVLVENPSLVTRCAVYDLTDPNGSHDLSDPDDAGKVAVFAYGPQRLLTTQEKSNILSDIENRSVAGLEIGVLNPYILDFYIEATISYFSQYDVAEITATLKQNLQQLHSPVSSNLNEDRLRYNNVLQFILSHPFVRSVDSLTLLKSNGASITNALKTGNNVTYTANNAFVVGDLVTVTGITPSGLNSTIRAITQRTATSFTVENASASGSYSSGGSAEVILPNWGDTSGNDILFAKKGSLLSLSEQRISLTMNSVTL
jgi:hypothetical protein